MVPFTEVLRRIKLVQNIIYHSFLRWIGHLIHMDDTRLSKHIIHWELSEVTLWIKVWLTWKEKVLDTKVLQKAKPVIVEIIIYRSLL